MKKSILLCAVLAAAFTSRSQTTDNLKMVDSTTTFSKLTTPPTRGTLIKTSNLHYYEINDKVSQKPSLAQPEIIVYQDGKKYKMKIQGVDKLLACNKVEDVIESKIDGDFSGWDGTTTFKLINQQEWKQDMTTSTVMAHLYRPAVLIYRSSEGYKMKVEGVNEDPIIVKKTK